MPSTVQFQRMCCVPPPRGSTVQDGIPDVIPPEACCLAWQESLALLAHLVEAEIPD